MLRPELDERRYGSSYDAILNGVAQGLEDLFPPIGPVPAAPRGDPRGGAPDAHRQENADPAPDVEGRAAAPPGRAAGTRSVRARPRRARGRRAVLRRTGVHFIEAGEGGSERGGRSFAQPRAEAAGSPR